MRTSGEHVIRLDGVSTVYEGEKRAAIKDVTLVIDREECVHVAGPNAAGKTTLIETINGLLQPIRGTVRVFGQNIRRHGVKVRCEIGYVPQDFVVDPSEPYTALDVVLMGMYGKIGVLHGPDGRDLEKALETMGLLGVDQQANRPIGRLSGGQQQKVMIARALAKEPKILLLDEPFSNLDADSRQRIPRLIGRFHEERGMTTIIVTHDANLTLRQCNRMVVMDEGRVVVDESPKRALPILRGYNLWQEVPE